MRNRRRQFVKLPHEFNNKKAFRYFYISLARQAFFVFYLVLPNSVGLRPFTRSFNNRLLLFIRVVGVIILLS